jgi:hypothetical protein
VSILRKIKGGGGGGEAGEAGEEKREERELRAASWEGWSIMRVRTGRGLEGVEFGLGPRREVKLARRGRAEGKRGREKRRLTSRPWDWYSWRRGTMFSASVRVDTIRETGVERSSPTCRRVSSVVWSGGVSEGEGEGDGDGFYEDLDLDLICET